MNANDSRPPYRQVAETLREDIQAGKYAPGDRLPSYSELAARFEVANMTARSAVRVLREEGWVHTVPGRGSFVSKALSAPGRASGVTRRTLETSQLELRWELTGAPLSRQYENSSVAIWPDTALAIIRPTRTGGDWEVTSATLYGRRETGTKRQGAYHSISFIEPLDRDTEAPDWLIRLLVDWRHTLDAPAEGED